MDLQNLVFELLNAYIPKILKILKIKEVKNQKTIKRDRDINKMPMDFENLKDKRIEKLENNKNR